VVRVTHEFLQNFWKLIPSGSFVKIIFTGFLLLEKKIPMGNICGWKFCWRIISFRKLKTSKKSSENILKPGHGLKII
jgi:hypothetical protein